MLTVFLRKIALTPHINFYETHISAIQAYAQAAVWFSSAHEDQGRAHCPESPSSTWPQTPPAERCRSPFRKTRGGLIASVSAFRNPRGYYRAVTLAGFENTEGRCKVVFFGSVCLTSARMQNRGSALLHQSAWGGRSFVTKFDAACENWPGEDYPSSELVYSWLW